MTPNGNRRPVGESYSSGSRVFFLQYTEKNVGFAKDGRLKWNVGGAGDTNHSDREGYGTKQDFVESYHISGVFF